MTEQTVEETWREVTRALLEVAAKQQAQISMLAGRVGLLEQTVRQLAWHFAPELAEQELAEQAEVATPPAWFARVESLLRGGETDD